MSALCCYLLIAVCLLYQLAAEELSNVEPAPCIKLTIKDMFNNIKYQEYYKDGDVVTVKCEYGYQPTSELLTCGSYSYPREWNPSSITCIARCTRPAGVPKESTSNGENVEVTVQCESGYYPTSESITCGSSNNPREWNPTSITCIARCKKLDIPNVVILPEDKEYYEGDEVTVECESGYSPTSEKIRCGIPGNPQEWNPSNITCIAQCERPTIEGTHRLSEDKKYYNKGEVVTVECNVGYYPSSPTMTCIDPPAWTPPTITCTAQCKKPDQNILWMLKMDPGKNLYNVGESVTVYCPPGYRPSSSDIKCVSPGTDNEWDHTPRCIAPCKKPDGNILTLYPWKEFYNKGDTVTVKCQVGYQPSPSTVRCVNGGAADIWDNPPQCIAQCKKPEGRMLRRDLWKNYYNVDDTVTVTCQPGYRPSQSVIKCVSPGTDNEWDHTPVCIAQCKKPDGNILKRDPEKEFYNIDDTVTVTCQRGYRPSSSVIRCVSPRAITEWDYTPPCIAQCKKPDGNILTMDPRKEFYNKGDTVTVTCQVGYQPSPSTGRCINGVSADFWDNPPQCIAQCTKPTIQNVLRMTEDRSYYNVGEELRVQCKPGYDPSSGTMSCNNHRQWTPPTITCTALCKRPDGTILKMDPEKEFYRNGDSVTVKCEIGYRASYSSVRCVNRRASNEWNNPPQCIAQCAHPVITNMKKNLDGYKKYYYKNGEISVQCDSGYYPSSDKMTCNNPRTSQEWTPSIVTCTGVTMTDWRITSTSISVRISCNPQCPDTWKFTVECCAEPDYRTCTTSYDRSATFTDLQPNSKYRINTKWGQYWGQYSLKSEDVRTGESVPGKLEIIKAPSMEDKTIRWSLSEKWGTITGFQMNISAWRDYNVSFAGDESLRLPSDVTKYEIPLQYGTNYTITLRGFTSVGAGNVTTQNIETDIGDPPRHMEKTLSDVTLQLHPVLDLRGPIRSYEIIVFDGQEGNSTMECLQYKNTPYNSSSALSPYTAAVLPAENVTGPRTFNLGDDQHYNGFHNAPLIPNHSYSVYIRVTSRWKHVEKSSCAFAGFTGGGTTDGTGGSFIIVLSPPSLGIIITMLSVKCLALVGLRVIPLTPWMGMRDPAQKRRKEGRKVSIEDEDDEKTYENPEEAESGM